MSFLFYPAKSYGGKIGYRCTKNRIGEVIDLWNSVLGSVVWNQNVCNLFLDIRPTNMTYVMSNPNSGYLKYGATNTDSAIQYYATDRARYDSMQFVNKSVVAYIQTAKLKDICSAGLYYYDVWTDPKTSDGESVSYAFSGATSVTGSEFLASHGEEIVITSVKFYDNSLDASSARPLLTGFIDAYMHLTFVGVTDTMHTDTTMGNGDFLFPLFTTLRSKDENYTNEYRSNAPEVFMCNQLTGCKTYVGLANASLGNTKVWTNMYKSFINISTLKGYLNAIGIPFTFTYNEAVNVPVENFTDYVPNGQPSDVTGGGTGTGDNESEDITNTTPSLSVISSFNSHYAMSQNMMNVLADYLWNSTFIENLALMFSSPAECLIGCKMFPFSISGHDSSHVGGDGALTIGNVETTATGKLISNGYNCIFDLGSITIEEYYGSAMDYEPYTSYQIYLPYIGIKDLSANDIVSKTLSIKYIVDITTGKCIAEIFVNTQLLYTFEGSIGVDIPLSSSNASQVATSNALSAISGVAGVATGIASGNPLIIAGSVISTAKSVASNQIHVNKGGVNAPFAGFYMPQYAYIIINKPIQSLASSFGAVHGFPCNVTKALSSLTGYTEVETPVLTGISATEDEKQQIIKLLETGVIIT